MTKNVTRLGLVGYGQIGQAVHQAIDADPDNGMEVVFINDMEAARLDQLPADLALRDLSAFAEHEVDLIVEMAHPDVTRQWGMTILEKTNYMFISVTALADDGMEEKLKAVTAANGTRVFIPHGGVVGMDALRENQDVWEEVHVDMMKNPKNVDCDRAGVDADALTEETVLYDGPTRGICPLFPRNVNTHASIAYAGIGFDRTHSVLRVSPEWSTATVTIHATGPGLELKVSRGEGITGVTGASTPASIYNSVQTIGSTGPGIHLR